MGLHPRLIRRSDVDEWGALDDATAIDPVVRQTNQTGSATNIRPAWLSAMMAGLLALILSACAGPAWT